MLILRMWGNKIIGIFGPQKQKKPDTDWLNAKALYDEAHEHLVLYEKLYAQAHAIDMACRQKMAYGGQA